MSLDYNVLQKKMPQSINIINPKVSKLITLVETYYNHVTWKDFILEDDSCGIYLFCLKLLVESYPDFEFCSQLGHSSDIYYFRIMSNVNAKYNITLTLDTSKIVSEIFIHIIRYLEACRVQTDYHKPTKASDMKICSCSQCGAPLNKYTYKCEYCGTEYFLGG